MVVGLAAAFFVVFFAVAMTTSPPFWWVCRRRADSAQLSLVEPPISWWQQPFMRIPIDREIALSVRDAIRDAGIPVVAVSYGANDPASAVFPMDWAVLIPAHFMGGRAEPQIPVAVVTPARDLSDDAHVRAGRAIGESAAASRKRTARETSVCTARASPAPPAVSASEAAVTSLKPWACRHRASA